jgi:peptide/nickel transport system permease protein
VTALTPNVVMEVPRPLSQPGALRRLLRRPTAIAALIFLVALVLASVAAPLIAPYDPRAQDLLRVLTGPSWHNLLGTDTLGRDVLSRILWGGRRSLLSVAEGVVVVLALGVPFGLVAGYFGGWVDRGLARLADVLLAVPAIILILVVLAVVPNNEDVAMVAFGVLGTPVLLRVTRAATLRVREDLYVAAARVSGLTHARIIVRHIFPRVLGPIVVQGSLFAAYALVFETGISFLGLTSDASTPTWGGMVGEASTVIQQQEWLIFPSGAVIAVTILAFGLLGDALRDVLVTDEGVRTAPKAQRASSTPVVRSAGSKETVGSDGLLSVRDLVVRYLQEGAETSVVDGVSFDVAAGETVGLIGESGCGKSVTAHALLRLLPPELRQSSGSIWWHGRDLSALDDREFDRLRGGSLAYISQEPQPSLDPTFTIGSQLIEVVRHHDRCSRRDARKRAFDLLRLVELSSPDEVARAHAHELSGGMAQRVAIALALAGRPRLLIADEPTTALDVTVQSEILALLRRLQQETGLAILVITHNWGVVADLCDRAVVMYAGQIVETAIVQRLFDQPMHPYTLGLLESHPSLAGRGDALTAMRGGVPSPGSWPTGCRFAPRCRFATPACGRAEIPLTVVEESRQSRCIRVSEIFAEVPA